MGHRNTTTDWAALGLAVAALAAFVVKLALAGQVADQQQQAAQRQSQIASANVLGQVNNQLIRMLVEAAARTDDRAIRGLLDQNGIRFNVRQGNPAPAPAEEARP